MERGKERERDDSFRSNRSQRRYAITRERDYVSLFLSPYPYLSLIIAWGYGAREAVSFPLSITVFSRGINVRLPHESGRTRFRLAIPDGNHPKLSRRVIDIRIQQTVLSRFTSPGYSDFINLQPTRATFQEFPPRLSER